MLRSIKRRTRWDRKSRLNVESDLLFNKDSDQHVIAPFKQAYNFANSNFAFSFFLQVNSSVDNDGTIFALRGESEDHKIEAKIVSGDLYFNFYRTGSAYISMLVSDFITRFVEKKCHILIQRNGGTANNHLSASYSIWVNGIKQAVTIASNTLGTNSHFNLGTTEGRLILGANLTTGFAVTDPFSGTIGNFCLLANSFTEKQVSYIHRNGGILPTTSHATALGHWPLTQKYGKIAYDAIEQYNYAKWILPQNFSGMAVFGTPSPWTLVSGTEYSYDKSINPTELQFTQTVVDSNNNAPRKIKIVFEITGAFDGDGIRWRGVVHDTFDYTQYYKDVGVYEFEVDLIDSHSTVDATRVRCEPATNTNTGQINFISVTVRSTLDANHADLINYTDLETGIPDPATNTAWRGFYSKQPLDWIDSVDGDGNIIEKESGLPEIKKAIDILNTHSFTNTGFGDLIGAGKMTFSVTLKLPSTNLIPSSSNFITLGSFNLNINATGIFRAAMGRVLTIFDSNAIDTNFVTIFLERDHSSILSAIGYINGWDKKGTPGDNVTGTLAGGNLVIKGLAQGLKIANVSVWNRFLTDKERLALVNGTLLKNPSNNMLSGLVGYYLYDPSQFYVEGASVKQNDLSGSGRHLTVTGFSGATAADKLADLKSNLIDINDLR